MKNWLEVWPQGKDEPRVSEMELPKQRHFVKVARATGYADNTIDLMVRITRAAMHYCDKDGRLLGPVPSALSKKEWMIKSDDDEDVVAATTSTSLLNCSPRRLGGRRGGVI